jgi:hypothetical protein
MDPGVRQITIVARAEHRTYDGWFRVTISGVHVGSLTVSSLPSILAARIAVTGRQNP